MENINYDENNFSAQDYLKQMAIAQQMMAERPQKKSESVFTTKTSTPYALEDMLALRDRIGNASRDLDRDLAKRETFMYSLANALSQMPQQEGPGSWVSALGRGFGAGYAGRTNALVDRAQKRYQAEMKDIEERAALDKMMGDKDITSQQTTMEYTETPKKDKKEKDQNELEIEQVSVISPGYWDQMIKNFDKRRPSEASYRNQDQAMRAIENKTLLAGDKDESYSRDILFKNIRGRKFMPLVRKALQGGGQISDYEDKKYSDWLEPIDDPVALKDTAVMIVNDFCNSRGLGQKQKNQILNNLGLTSIPTDLLPQQVMSEPERVKTEQSSIQNVLQKYGATEVE